MVVILPHSPVEFLFIAMARVLLNFNELGPNACDAARSRTALLKKRVST